MWHLKQLLVLALTLGMTLGFEGYTDEDGALQHSKGHKRHHHKHKHDKKCHGLDVYFPDITCSTGPKSARTSDVHGLAHKVLTGIGGGICCTPSTHSCTKVNNQSFGRAELRMCNAECQGNPAGSGGFTGAYTGKEVSAFIRAIACKCSKKVHGHHRAGGEWAQTHYTENVIVHHT